MAFKNSLTLSSASISADESAKLPEDIRPLTYRESAELLGVCQKTVENICRVRKEIPITWIGQKPRILYGDLIAYIKRGGSNDSNSN